MDEDKELFSKKEKSIMKKASMIIVSLLVLFFIAFWGIREFARYNKVDFCVGYAASPDGNVVYPMLETIGFSRWGTSKKAKKQIAEVTNEWNDKVGYYVIDILTNYQDKTMQSTVREMDGKTEVHIWGSGIPKEGTEREEFDHLVVFERIFQINNSSFE